MHNIIVNNGNLKDTDGNKIADDVATHFMLKKVQDNPNIRITEVTGDHVVMEEGKGKEKIKTTYMLAPGLEGASLQCLEELTGKVPNDLLPKTPAQSAEHSQNTTGKRMTDRGLNRIEKVLDTPVYSVGGLVRSGAKALGGGAEALFGAGVQAINAPVFGPSEADQQQNTPANCASLGIDNHGVHAPDKPLDTPKVESQGRHSKKHHR